MNRLVIETIIQTNFKSYGGRVEIGPFDTKFTAIVGPNGSGKSNVIDSLLFVFGFKAKKLRQQKVKDLIHNSKEFPDLDFCQVDLHFALFNDESNEIKENTKFIVSRIARKRGDSNYLLNGSQSSYSEIQALLKGHGVDLDHKRFLILQGEVESISLMKPKATGDGDEGLLEYLEDIIGTASYQQPIVEATNELDRLNDVYDDELLKFKHSQKETLGLKDKSEDALKYIEWENQICWHSNRLLQLQIHSGNQSLKESEESLSSTITLIEEIEKNQAKEAQDTKHFDSEISALKNEIKSLTDKMSHQNKLLSCLEKSEIELKETEKFKTQKKKRLTKSISEDKHKRTEDQVWVSNFEADTSKAKEEAAQLKERLVNEEKTLEEIQISLQDKTQVFQTQIEEKQKILAPFQGTVNDLTAQMNVNISERDLLESKINGPKQIVEDCIHRLNDIRIRMKERKQERLEALGHIESLTESLNEKKNLLKDIEKTLETARKEFSVAKNQIDEAEQSNESQKSRSKVHTALKKLAKSGQVPGICGRLGDLGTIDANYDIAITTCCGGLESVVVDTVEAGQQCIAYLKEHDLGRATFLCLDKLNVNENNMKKMSTPENAHRIFDLVKATEPKIRRAFYHALNDTLVAEDLAQANRIAYGKTRYRVVTLSGQLIDKSGTMTGGGNRVLKGGMSSKRPQEQTVDVGKLEREMNACEKIVSKMTLQKGTVSKEIEELENELERLGENVSKLEMNLTFCNDEKKDAKESMEQAESDSVPAPEDISRLEELIRVIEALKKRLETPQKSVEEITLQIKGLQNEIMEVGGVRLRSQIGKVDGLNDQIGAIQKKLAKLVAEKSTREKNLSRSGGTIEKRNKELENIEEELEEITAKSLQAGKESKECRDKVTMLAEEIETKEEELSKIKSELNDRTEQLNGLRGQLIELKAKEASEKQCLKSLSGKLKLYKSELEGLELTLTGFEEVDSEMKPLETFSLEQLNGMNVKKCKSELEKLRLVFGKNTPNLSVLKEYRNKMEVYKEKQVKVDQAANQRDEKKKEYDGLRKERLEKFMTGFQAISLKLKEMYQMITLGGNAELELVDSLDPFSEGVLFSVMPPKKSWKNIANLSGGEKTLSSLALVFALHHFKPTPLYVMDEIDAALDFRNVSIIANYIKQRTRNAQFVIISLRNNMFELADRLVGIYKTDNISKSISINPNEVENAVHPAQDTAAVASAS